MSLDPKRVQAVFLSAVESQEPTARAAVLDRECSGDVELRRQVEALLKAREEHSNLLDQTVVKPEHQGFVTSARSSLAPSDVTACLFGADLEPAEQLPSTDAHSLGSDPDRTLPVQQAPNLRASSERPAPSVDGYEILGELGRGGMGVVYRARHVGLNRPCVLKMILGGAHAGVEATARFLAEAEAVARLQHPNIVQIHHIGEADGLPFFELEYVPGGSLDRRLDGKPWPARLAAELIESVARGVAEAHRQGIVHRDLKPGNVLLAADGTPKITDFGLAKSLAAESGLTRTDSIMGSPGYMSPEQAEGKAKQVGPLADVYALGAILYELLTGGPPFRGTTALEILGQVKNTEPVPPSRLVPGLPRDVETIALKCLQKEPEKRYLSAAQLAEDLGRYLGGKSIVARPVPFWENGWRWCRRNPAVASLVAAVMIVTVTGAGVASFFAIRAENERGKAVKREDEAILARTLAEAASDQATKARAVAEEAAEEARRRLTRLYVFTGTKYQDDGDTPAAVLWFHRAWEQDHADPLADAAHRARIAGALAEMPDLIGACFHNAAVCDAVFSPNGKRALTRTVGNEAYLWDYEQSRLSAPPLVHAGRVRHICYSPDGKSVATASADGTACVWDSATGAKRYTLRHEAPLTWVAFHPDGKRLLTSAEDKSVRMWSARDGKLLNWRLPVHTVVDHLAFSPDGSRLLTAGQDKTVRVWDVDPPKLISPILPFRPPTDVERYTFNQDRWPKFAPDGRAVISIDGDRLHLWPGGATDTLWEIPATGNRNVRVVEVYFVPGSDRVLVTAENPTARLIGLNDGKVVHTLLHPRQANLGAVSPDGKWLLTCSSGGLVTLWNAATGRRAGPPQRFGDFCNAVAFSPDGSRYLAASDDGTARIWATGPRKPLFHAYQYDCGRANVVTVVMKDRAVLRSYSPDGQRWVEWSKEGKAWCGTGPNVPPQPIAHAGPVTAARFCDDGSRLVVAGGRAIRAWHSDSLTPAGPPIVSAIPFAPQLNTAAALERLRPVQLSRDGTRIVCSDDEKTLSVWDLTTGLRVFGPSRHPDPGPLVFGEPGQIGWVTEAVLSTDGRRLAVGIDTTGTLTVWDVETGKLVHHNRRFRGFFRKLQFSDDGQRIFVFTSDGMARMFDADTGNPLGPAVSQPGRHLAVGVSLNGRRLVLYDDSVHVFRVFDVERGERLLTLPYGNRNEPMALWFDAADRSVNAVLEGELLTFPLPRFDVLSENSAALLRFLTGQLIDDSDSIQFVDQFTFKKDPDHFRDVFRAWKSLPL